MTKIHHTNFVFNQERHDSTVEAGAPYSLFEPVVEHTNSNGSTEKLDRDAALEQMKEYVTRLDLRPPYTIPLGGGSTHSVGEVIDSEGSNLLEEINMQTPAPEAMIGILTTVAQIAERSGFDRNKSRIVASFMYPTPEGNPNLNIHTDGLSNLVREDTTQVRSTRFVYALGPGTIIFPKIDKFGEQMDVNYEAELGVSTIEAPTPLQELNSPRGAVFNEEELVAGGAQQVMPGVILGFDPTRAFWHQAPNVPRPILVIDVKQAD